MPRARVFNRRHHERFALPAMYTSIGVEREVQRGSFLIGHAYDISEGGVRLELDEPLPPGDRVHLCIGLPGQHDQVRVRGEVVRVNDSEDDPGPRRMAVCFTDFDGQADHERLSRFLGSGCPRLVA